MLLPINIKIKWGKVTVKLPDHNSRVTLTGDLAGVEIWGRMRSSKEFQPRVTIPDELKSRIPEFAKMGRARVVSCDWEDGS